MKIVIQVWCEAQNAQAVEIWNQVVLEGNAFPQMECLTESTGAQYFAGQSYTGVAMDAESGRAIGVYTLHPNNVGRCGHICNASYAVHRDVRGHGVGEALVRHCMATAKSLGFRILQFNAVVKTNVSALHLYEKLGFQQLGVIPGGFRMDGGQYEDIIPHYIGL
ncbi:MAG: GNAT family N-acetyltransferase [Eubacteriales bacterium]|nr:GNAT family N-acetyltransferase [Eubacteriales bacterium]